MKITCSLLLLCLTLATASAASAHGPRRPRPAQLNHPGEQADPSPTPGVVDAARLRTAYLADALCLSHAQTRQLQCPTSEMLRQLHVLAAEPLGGRPAAEADILTCYQQRLTRILTTSQYLRLLRLETPRATERPPLLLATERR